MKNSAKRLYTLALTLVLSTGALSLNAMAAPIGSVTKLEAVVTASQKDQTRRLEPASQIHFRDNLRSGPSARLEATLADDTVLTLGENARMTIDEFVYNPAKKNNRLAIKVSQGAFLFVGGKIEEPAGGNVVIKTPVGTLGVRGTTVWGGYIDGGYGVLVLSGEVDVMTKKGRVKLAAGQGTMVYKDRKPMAAGAWPADRTERAVKTISFGLTPMIDRDSGIIRKP